MRLVDEGYITLTYNDPIPEAGFLKLYFQLEKLSVFGGLN